MFAVDWENVGYAGSFVVGALVGVAATIRLAKVVAAYLTDLRKESDHDRK